MTEKILVGLDDSSQSWNALHHAMDIAKDKDLDKITAIHSEEGGDETDVEDYRTAEEILERAEELGEDHGVEVETHLLVKGRSPDVEIIKFAEENDFNHIIIGSKGRTGLSRMLLGSVAESVVEKSHCVVTVVRGECPL